MVQWSQSSQQLDIILKLTYAIRIRKYVQLSRYPLNDPEYPYISDWGGGIYGWPIAPGRPLTQRTMVAGGLTLMKNDANNDADDIIAMITVRSIIIDYSQSGLSNRDDRYYKRNQINRYSSNCKRYNMIYW